MVATKTPISVRALAELELRNRQETSADIQDDSPYSQFKRTYRDNPAGFVNDCILWKEGQGSSFYQEEILSNLVSYRRESARGPHGLGKTALIAWAVLWFALTNDGDTDWKIPITASAWRQLTKFAMPEIRKWARKLNWQKIGREPFNERLELTQLSLKLSTGEAFALASDNSALIEGAHASRILYIFDESKEIPAGTWDSAEGAFSTGDCYWLAVSTPGEPSGRFYEIQAKRPGYEDWHVRHVALEDAIEAGRIDKDWAEKRKRQWGEDSAVYQNRVKGEFASSEADGVIPLSWIEKANERWNEWNDAKTSGHWPDESEYVELAFTSVGVDVARSGEDRTVLALRFERVISEIRDYHLEDTMETTGRVVGVLEKNGGKAIVDVIGIGAGVVDRLRELRKSCIPFNASEHTDFMDSSGELGFINCRSGAWWNLRELLDPDSGNNIALPESDLLTGDLVAPHWQVQSGGKIQVEAKDDIKERIGRSTDFGDAVVMAFWEQSFIPANSWIAATKNRTKR
ncbi:MAG: hypothetical protein M0R06_02625 [Sphaerochaeta sp.]|jgi:hypothetical protein|nr:hypothetical protein [Sphaerochaeta sp.]